MTEQEKKARTAVKILQEGEHLLTLDGSRKGVSRQLIASLENAVKGNLSAVSFGEIQTFNIEGETVQGNAPQILLSFIAGLKDDKGKYPDGITFQVLTAEGKVTQEATLKGIESLAGIVSEFKAYSTRESGGRGEKTHAGIASLLNPQPEKKPAS